MNVVDSKEEICNMALGYFGEARISSINDSSNVARTCKQYFAQTRDAVLRSHLWNFAMGRKALSALADAPLFEYSYAYQLPEDFIRLAAVNDLDAYDYQACEYPFTIEQNQILSNSESCKIRYVKRIEDVTQYDALFVEAFSMKLSSVIVGKLSGDWQQAQTLLRTYSGLMESKARAVDANEDRHRRRSPSKRSRLVQSRYSRNRR